MQPAAELSGRRIERGDFAAAEIPNEYVLPELSEACRGLGHAPWRVEPRAVLETKQEIAGTVEFIDVAQPASLLLIGQVALLGKHDENIAPDVLHIKRGVTRRQERIRKPSRRTRLHPGGAVYLDLAAL